MLLRYAEVLLTYAEAKIELGELDQSVYDAINTVRQREDVSTPPATPTQASGQADAVSGSELNGQRYIRQGNWKMVYINSTEPFVRSGEWKLYNIADDSGETKDLAQEHPGVVECLL